MEKSIASIIQDSFNLDNKIKRIQYVPYSEKVAKNVWHELLKSLIGKEPVYDNFKSTLYLEMIKWIHADESCIYELDKGIILAGSTGPGKTKTFETMRLYSQIDNVFYLRSGKQIKLEFKIFNSRQIVSDYVNNGFDGIEKYSIYPNICIDDLGTESREAKYFGTNLNCIEEIIERRYLKGLITHISTNFPLDKMSELYSDRVYSRLKEMCNYIVFEGEDLRIN